MKVAIYGAGSLGTILGAYIQKGGVDVDLITRNQEHVDALNKNGAHIVGTVDFVQKVSAMRPDEMKDKYDLIILATKQMENNKTIPKLLNYLKDDGVITTIQNGMPELNIIDLIGEDKVIGCVVEWGATRKEAGVSELTSKEDSMSFEIGRIDGKITEKVKEVASVLELMCPVVISENFVGSRFSKILINSSFSGMSTALGATFGEVAENEKSRIALQGIIKEAIDISKEANIKIPEVQGMDIVKLLDYNNDEEKKKSFEIIPLIIKNHAKLEASMLQDIRRGRKTEIDYINGVIKELGEKYNIKTPYNNKTIEIIKEIEKGNKKAEFKNIEEYNNI